MEQTPLFSFWLHRLALKIQRFSQWLDCIGSQQKGDSFAARCERTKKIHTHYDNLKVARNAPPEVIDYAYKALSQKYHPAQNPAKSDAVRIMMLVDEAYDVLSDPIKRREHDLWIDCQEVGIEDRDGENESSEQIPYLNKSQRRILIATTAMVVIIFLFPPFHYHYPRGIVENVGFGFLFNPPKVNAHDSGNVNTVLLLTEIFTTVLLGGLLAFAFKKKK